jgi:hypothetical protein
LAGRRHELATLEYATSPDPRPDLERDESEISLHNVVADRWTGRAVMLWAGDEPTETAFWGFSGD